jgi:tripartite-type tricarboxylate transporter receptor subunit TctC
MQSHLRQPYVRRRLGRAGFGVALLLMAGTVVGQDPAATYPSRPIRIVVGFTPGGPTDRIARELGAALHEAWGQPVVVENRPGAGSRIAFEIVARAEPDGYTLLLSALQTATNMSVYKTLNYDTLRDFAPVTQVTSTVLALTVAPTLAVRSVTELVTLGRSRPEGLTYASFGVASSSHFAGTLFEQRSGVPMTHVPYAGAAPAEIAIVGGQVDIGFMSALSAMPLMQAGKLRALAIAADKRLAQLPGVPTMAEAGYPAFEVSSWQGLLAPARTPPSIVAKLHAEIVRILARPDVRERFAAVAAEPVGSTPSEFRAYIESEIERWTLVARRANILLD